MYHYKCNTISLSYHFILLPFSTQLIWRSLSLKCLFHQWFSVLAHDLFFHDVSLEFVGSAYWITVFLGSIYITQSMRTYEWGSNPPYHFSLTYTNLSNAMQQRCRMDAVVNWTSRDVRTRQKISPYRQCPVVNSIAAKGITTTATSKSANASDTMK